MTPDEPSQTPLPPHIKDLIQEINRRGFRALFGLDPLLLRAFVNLVEAGCSDEEIERRMTDLQARLVRERRRGHAH